MKIDKVSSSIGDQTEDPQSRPRPADGTPVSSFHGGPINILIVDDEPKNLTVLETVLDNPGYRLVRAESADQALLALVSEEFALLILDIRMPGMTGFELAHLIKERKKTARVPIIFLTAYYNEDQHVLEGYGAGAVDYLHKPVNPSILRSKVAVFADLHHKNRALLAEVAQRRRAEHRLRELNETLEQRVTERTEALRRSERNLSDFFDNASVGLHWVGPDGIIIKVNQAELDLLGYSREEYVGHHIAEFHVDQPIIQDILDRLAGGETLREYPARIRCKDGSILDVLINSNGLFEDDKFIHTRCFTRDVTRHRRAEKELRESDERMRLATEATQVGIWEWNVVTNQIHWDAQMFRIYGIAPTADGFVDYTDWSGAVLPEDLVENEAILQDTLRQCGKSERTFHIRRRDDGECRLITAVETVRANAQGQAEWVVGTNLDITERKQKEEALHASEERLLLFAGQLEHLVKERTDELMQSQDRLRALAMELNLAEQRERKRLADELHDYLAQLLVLVRLNLGQIKGIGLPPKAEEKVGDTEEVLTKALNYCRTLMAELSPPVLHEHGLAVALGWLGEQMARRGLPVRVDVGGAADVRFPVDTEVLLFQSVRELLLNALKYAECREVAVRMEQADGRLRLEICDDGVGFESDAIDGYSPTAMSSKFGLFSIRERMRSLGGWFDMQSAPGQGTTATLVLPIGDGAVAGSELKVLSSKLGRPEPGVSSNQVRNSEPRTQNSTLHQQHAKIHVLLVDDHAMVRQGLKSVLDSYADIEVVGEAGDGEEAIAATERLRPAIVLMDIHMPKMNGMEATARIKARYPEIIVIGMSVQADNANREAMTNAGAAMLLTKEAAVDELYRAICQAMTEEPP